MKSEQIRLYNHYKKLSETNNGTVGKNAAKHAADILEGYPGLLEEGKKEKK